MRPLLSALLLLAACHREPAPTVAPTPLDATWMAGMVREPASFEKVLASTSKDGWVAFHGHDFAAAVKAFQGPDPAMRLARARATLEVAWIYADLARSGDLAFKTTFDTWKSRGAIPAGSGLPLVAGLAALDSGHADEAATWFQLCLNAREGDVAAACHALASVKSLDEAVKAAPGPLSARLGTHVAARTSGDTSAVDLEKPLIEETFEGTPHRYPDPLVLKTLALASMASLEKELGTKTPLEFVSKTGQGVDPGVALLFSPVISLDDARAEATRAASAPGTYGAHSRILADLQLSAPPSTGPDEADLALSLVRAIDARLDTWAAEAFLGASADGQALYRDLRLGAVWRSHLLLALARQAMVDNHPREALAFCWSALDLQEAKEITPTNHPGLQAIVFEGQLRTGHTREALDALQPLLTPYPATRALNEVVGDLAILEGLTRIGDSKEN